MHSERTFRNLGDLFRWKWERYFLKELGRFKYVNVTISNRDVQCTKNYWTTDLQLETFCGLTLQEVIDMCDFAVGLSRQLNGSIIPSERELASLLCCFQNSHICNLKQFFVFCNCSFSFLVESNLWWIWVVPGWKDDKLLLTIGIQLFFKSRSFTVLCNGDVYFVLFLSDFLLITTFIC